MMAYKARTLTGPPNKTAHQSGRGGPRTVANVALSGTFQTYSGEPPKELLEADDIDVQTMLGKPWPSSTRDRNSKKPHTMRVRRDDGKWPTHEERVAQEFAERKLADPEGVARAVLKAQGLTKEQIELQIARSKKTARGFEGALAALAAADAPPPKRGPGRPRKTPEE